MNVDVITVGSATLDVFLKSNQFWVVPLEHEYMLCQKFNQKIDVGEAEISSGGGATNTAVGFARAGFRSACISEIGKDFSGDIVIQDLLREHVDTSMLITEKSERTALAVLLIAERGERTALVYRVASRMLTVEDIIWPNIQSKWVHLSSIGNTEVIQRLMKHCRDHAIGLSWNPGMWELEAFLEKRLIVDWSAVDALFVNKEEFEKLVGRSVILDTSVAQSWTWQSSPKHIVVTDGKNGGVVISGGRTTVFEVDDVQDTIQETGAGDAFACGFVCAMLRNQPLEVSIRWGKQESASVVKQIGAKKGLLSRFS